MAYIGAEPVPGQNREVDDISSGFNGSTTAFTLQVSSSNVSPESANNILINLGGVLQNPGTDYTIAASTITFTTAPAAGLSFFGLILGAGINTATVADDTIGASKLIDTAVTAGSYTTADITVDAQGRITAAANGTISGAEIADQAVTNAKVNNSAAIAGTKINPDFGSQNIVTTGSITGNDLEIDSGTLSVDASNNRVGIGTSSPGTTLSVSGTGDGVLNLDTSDSRGAFVRFGQGGSFHNMVGCADGITSGDKEDLGVRAADNIIFATGGSTERFRVDSSGNLGINTSNPSHLLEVNGNISLGNGGGSGGSEMLRIFNDSGVERIHGSNNPSALAFGMGGTGSSNEALRIDASKRLLINRTSAFSTGTSGTESAKLQVGISGTSGTAVGFADTGGFDTNVMVLNHARAGANSGAFSGVMIQFRNNVNTTVGGISCGSSTTTYSTSSDYRLKENEVLISDGITRLKQLKPYKFNFKTTPTITQEGFFAHEAQAVVPQAVRGTKDGMRPETYYEEGDELPSGKVVGDVKTYSSSEIDIQQLDYSQLVPLLTAALQEAISKIETLETKVAALEAA